MYYRSVLFPSHGQKKIRMINKQHIYIVALLLAMVACDSPNQQKSAENAAMPDREAEAIRQQVDKDTMLLQATDEILAIMKARDYRKLAEHFHSEEGVRFSPYGYIDTAHHVQLGSSMFIKLLEEEKPLIWGSYDGTGKEISMPVEAYFDKFVYDVDFLNAEQKSVNEILGKGNSLVNIQQVFPGADFTESHFSGFDEKYGGMDWRSLRLIFRPEAGKPRLVGIVHDKWMI